MCASPHSHIKIVKQSWLRTTWRLAEDLYLRTHTEGHTETGRRGRDMEWACPIPTGNRMQKGYIGCRGLWWVRATRAVYRSLHNIRLWKAMGIGSKMEGCWNSRHSSEPPPFLLPSPLLPTCSHKDSLGHNSLVLSLQDVGKALRKIWLHWLTWAFVSYCMWGDG